MEGEAQGGGGQAKGKTELAWASRMDQPGAPGQAPLLSVPQFPHLQRGGDNSD